MLPGKGIVLSSRTYLLGDEPFIKISYLPMLPDKIKDAARGYLLLKMPIDALDELQRLLPEDRQKSDTLDLYLAAQMMIEDWNAAADTGLRLCKLRPKQGRYFIHAAFCLHETGDTNQAKQILLSGPKELLDDPLFHYNMACYLAVLGNSNQAKHYLSKAIGLDTSLETTAGKDPDLQSVVNTE